MQEFSTEHSFITPTKQMLRNLITEYSLFERFSVNKNPLSNIYRNSYLLSCMAIDRKMLKKIMPVPKSIPVTAQWIGIIASVYGKVRLIDIPLMYCRVDKSKRKAFEENFKKMSNTAVVSKLYRRIFFGN